MLTAGDETGRTQGGNNNAYCLDDETTWVSWQHDPSQRDLYAWTRALLAVRRDHPALRPDRFVDGAALAQGSPPPLAWFGADGAPMTAERWFDHGQRVLGMYVPGLLVWLNTGPVEQTVQLPGAPWASGYQPLLDTADEQPSAGPPVDAGAPLTLAPWTVRVLRVQP
jgi:glycogen operon protein